MADYIQVKLEPYLPQPYPQQQRRIEPTADYTEWKVETLLPQSKVAILGRKNTFTDKFQAILLSTESSPQITKAHAFLHYITFASTVPLRILNEAVDLLCDPQGVLNPQYVTHAGQDAIICDYYDQYRHRVHDAALNDELFASYWSSEIERRWCTTIHFECYITQPDTNYSNLLLVLRKRLSPRQFAPRGRQQQQQQQQQQLVNDQAIGPMGGGGGKPEASLCQRAGWVKHLKKPLLRLFGHQHYDIDKPNAAILVCHAISRGLPKDLKISPVNLDIYHGWHVINLVHWINTVPNWVVAHRPPTEEGSMTLVTVALSRHATKYPWCRPLVDIFQIVWYPHVHKYSVLTLLSPMEQLFLSGVHPSDSCDDLARKAKIGTKFPSVTEESADRDFLRELLQAMQKPPAPWWIKLELWPSCHTLRALMPNTRSLIAKNAAENRAAMRRGKVVDFSEAYQLSHPPAVVCIRGGQIVDLRHRDLIAIGQTNDNKLDLMDMLSDGGEEGDGGMLREDDLRSYKIAWVASRVHVAEWVEIIRFFRRPPNCCHFRLLAPWTDIVEYGSVHRQSMAMAALVSQNWQNLGHAILCLPRSIYIQLRRYTTNMADESKCAWIPAWLKLKESRSMDIVVPKQLVGRGSHRIFLVHAEHMTRREWMHVKRFAEAAANPSLFLAFSPALGGQPLSIGSGLSHVGNSVSMLMNLRWPLVTSALSSDANDSALDHSNNAQWEAEMRALLSANTDDLECVDDATVDQPDAGVMPPPPSELKDALSVVLNVCATRFDTSHSASRSRAQIHRITYQNIDAAILALPCPPSVTACLSRYYEEPALREAAYDMDRMCHPVIAISEALERQEQWRAKTASPIFIHGLVTLSSKLHPLSLLSLLCAAPPGSLILDQDTSGGMDWLTYCTYWKTQAWRLNNRQPCLPLRIANDKTLDIQSTVSPDDHMDVSAPTVVTSTYPTSSLTRRV